MRRFLRRHVIPGLTLMGASLAAVGIFYGLPALTLIGAVSAAAGAMASHIARLEAIDQVSSIQVKLSEKNDEIGKLTREIADLSKKAIGDITGGDSFCYLMFGPSGVDINTRLMMAVHRGEHPLYEVHADAVDIINFKIPTIESLITGKGSGRRAIDIGSLTPGTAKPIALYNFTPGERYELNIFYSARNGLWTQLFRAAMVNGNWVFATRTIRRGGEGKSITLHEQIEADFPEQSGDALWDRKPDQAAEQAKAEAGLAASTSSEA